MSALEGKAFDFATIQPVFEGVEMNHVDRLRENQQRNGVVIRSATIQPKGSAPA